MWKWDVKSSSTGLQAEYCQFRAACFFGNSRIIIVELMRDSVSYAGVFFDSVLCVSNVDSPSLANAEGSRD